MFFTAVDTMKTESGAFPAVVPLSVKKEIVDTFNPGRSINTNNSTGDNDQNVQTLSKTPVWVIAHCLDRTMSNKQ